MGFGWWNTDFLAFTAYGDPRSPGGMPPWAGLPEMDGVQPAGVAPWGDRHGKAHAAALPQVPALGLVLGVGPVTGLVPF